MPDSERQARTPRIMRFPQPHDPDGRPCLPTNHPRSQPPWPTSPTPTPSTTVNPRTCWPTSPPSPTRARPVAGPTEATIRRTLSRRDPDALAVAVGAWLADRDRGPGPGRSRPAAGGGGRRQDAGWRPPTRRRRPPGAPAGGDGPHQPRGGGPTRASAARPRRCPRSPRCWPHWTSPTSWSPPTPSRPTPRPPGFLVTSNQAHDLLVVKANQPTLLDRLKRLAWRLVPELDRTGDRGHGRIEIRTLKAVSVHHFGFPHAAQVLQVTRMSGVKV